MHCRCKFQDIFVKYINIFKWKSFKLFQDWIAINIVTYSNAIQMDGDWLPLWIKPPNYCQMSLIMNNPEYHCIPHISGVLSKGKLGDEIEIELFKMIYLYRYVYCIIQPSAHNINHLFQFLLKKPPCTLYYFIWMVGISQEQIKTRLIYYYVTAN